MDKIAQIPAKQRSELFQETARLMKTTNAIVEKDFWVVWVLNKLFSDDRLNKILMFKGGTSLSKIFNLIGRFSEDIDLILDWREVAEENPLDEQPSKTKQMKFNEQINENAKMYIKEKLLPIISEILSPQCSCECDIDDKSNYFVNINYPSTFTDIALRPKILLEIGPLASWVPSARFKIESYVAVKFPHLFEEASCSIYAVLAKRTFWEKATILHQEANRTADKKIPLRHSRHYYDLAQMAQSSVKDEALKDLKLLEDVVVFKQKFYMSAWAKYEEAKIGTFKILPPEFRYKELKADYNSMRSMIYDKYLEFDEIIEILKKLESEINSL